MKLKYTIGCFFVAALFSSVHGIANAEPVSDKTDSLQVAWADSVLSSLSLDEKIAQLMMLRTYSNKDRAYYDHTADLIRKYNIGGLCFFQGGPIEQAKLTNRYQGISKTPLFIAMDAEWGLGMRLDSCFSFPYQMTLGAIDDNDLIYEMSSEIARQLKEIGVNINFAPVVDINNNPMNPVINSRSFGEDKFSVAEKGIAYMKGLQDNGIIATGKHFPGHGDTDSDSHLTLPVVPYTRQRLDSLELFPFRQLIKNDLEAVMVAHLFVPQLDSTPNTPTTLSNKVVTGLLRNELGFKGLIITDALDMKGVTSHFKPGEIEVKAFRAGNDILLLPQDVGKAIESMKKAVDSGLITEEMIDERCFKILTYKYRAGLENLQPVNTDSLFVRINPVENELISRKIYQSAITVVQNQDSILPLKALDTLKVASLAIGSPQINPFQEMLGNYLPIDNFNLYKDFTDAKAEEVREKLSAYNLVVVSIHNTNIYATKNFGITSQSIQLINDIADSAKVIVVLFSNPYSLALLDEPKKPVAIVMGYEDNRLSNEIAAQIIMGGLPSRGRLPVSAAEIYPVKTGLFVNSAGRLRYTIPEEAGICSTDLNRIDSIALDCIDQKAAPGCEILVAKDGMVIYRKSFGYHTYKKGEFVKNTDLYDLASITKVAATTLSIMKLSDEKKIDIDFKLSSYLPSLKRTNKKDLIIREIMAHQARLKPWIPFYMNTLKDNKPDTNFYSAVPDKRHTLMVTSNLYLRNDYPTAMYDTILATRLLKKKEYRYSDLGFYLLKQAIETITGQPLTEYVQKTFYKPLGLQTMGFNPSERFPLSSIVPTENDDYFRMQLIHGFVHDPGAAMLGGVSGHAGLFSDANDLAIIMQMLLQKGEYGDVRYIDSNTVKEFTKQQYPLNNNRRGIGFDKPEPQNHDEGPTCESASNESYGHTGFTGTYSWNDPKYNLVYIFLSNRVNPTASNNKLTKLNIRTNIQQVIYDAILKSEKRKAPTESVGALK